jgi:hypothetical protein
MKQSLRKAVALALMRWYGQLKPEVVRQAGDLRPYVTMSWSQVLKALEAMDDSIDWSIVWVSLIHLNKDQLYKFLGKEDLTVEDITAAGAARVIEGLGDE